MTFLILYIFSSKFSVSFLEATASKRLASTNRSGAVKPRDSMPILVNGYGLSDEETY